MIIRAIRLLSRHSTAEYTIDPTTTGAWIVGRRYARGAAFDLLGEATTLHDALQLCTRDESCALETDDTTPPDIDW